MYTYLILASVLECAQLTHTPTRNVYVYAKWAIDNSVIAMWWESIYQAYLFIWSAVTKYGWCVVNWKKSERMHARGREREVDSEVANRRGFGKWQIVPIKNSKKKKKKDENKKQQNADIFFSYFSLLSFVT